MNIFADIRRAVLDIVNGLVVTGQLPADLQTSPVTVEPTRDSAHGDMASNVAMVLGKPAGMRPRDLAVMLADNLAQDPRIARVDIAGPGFLNLRLAPDVWHGVVRAVLDTGGEFGRSDIGRGRQVNVEYVSANPTGPLHVGHTRGAVFGDALAALLAFTGHEVTREYYINDGGAQVDVLARSVYLRYLEAHGKTIAFEDGTYPGKYLIPVGQALKDKVGTAYLDQHEDVWLADVRAFSIDAMMDLIRGDLAALGVQMDQFYSEKSLYGTGRIEAALEDLRAKGLIYQGYLEPPKGKMPEDWEPREQTLFRSTDYGDDVDRPVMKSDGSWTYFAPDIAYHYDKLERGYELLIDVFGADHGGYVKRMKAAVGALSDGHVPLEIKLTQLVRLFKGGVEYKMSKRAGTFVTLRDLVDEVGPDVVRFMMLTRKNDAMFDFDLDAALEQSRENPVFYVQYAHARVQSVLRRAEDLPVGIGEPDLSHLAHEAEHQLIIKLAEWPRLVEAAAHANEPHRIAFYLYDLAGVFHALWNRGHDTPELRFLQEDNLDASRAKIALAHCTAIVIATGLGILGVKPANEMR